MIRDRRGSELLLGLDVGTSSTKGVLARPDGEVVASAERFHRVSSPRPGWAEHDAEEVWWREFKEVCAGLLEEVDGRVVAVCVSGIGPCFVATGEGGRPLRPAILYGIDTRATREIEELTDMFGFANIVERCGNALTSQSTGPKIAWLRRTEPEVWKRTRYLLTAHTLIAYRLTGEYVLDHPSASLWEPLYSIERNRWIEDWTTEIAPGLKMPELRWPGELAGEVTPEAAEATGLQAGTPVAVGSSDAFSEATSVGIRHPGDVMIMYGTSTVVLEILERTLCSPNLWSTAGLYPGTNALAGGTATSGALTTWLKKISGDIAYEDLTREAAAVPPGSDALVVLPYFAGERTPFSDPGARGVMCGLTLGHGRGHLYRALLESTAYGLKHLLDAMSHAGGHGKRFVAVGGGTKGGLWTQIVSDVTGKPQELPEQTAGASYGDALLAGIAGGHLEPDTTWNSISSTVEPNPNNREVYGKLYDLYRDLYPATSSLAHLLADLQTSGGSVVDGTSDIVKR